MAFRIKTSWYYNKRSSCVGGGLLLQVPLGYEVQFEEHTHEFEGVSDTKTLHSGLP